MSAIPRNLGVQVVVRTRPTAAFAQDRVILDETANTITLHMKSSKPKEAKIDYVKNTPDTFGYSVHKLMHNTSQESVFADVVSPMVSGAMEGVNGTVLCYGQSGSGKTFTMTGETSNPKLRGAIPRALSSVFAYIRARPEADYSISLTYFEIYNEHIIDLLSETKGDEPTIIEDPKRNATVIRGITRQSVSNEDDAVASFFMGNSRRTISRLKGALHSSNRAHSILTVHVEQRLRVHGTVEVVKSKLNLVDLAASKRVEKSKTTDRAEELENAEQLYINKSLSFLEQCITALSSKSRSHIPYRQSKLTNYLKDSLGGDCSILLIGCLWAELRFMEESLSTLNFVARMVKMRNGSSSSSSESDITSQLRKYEKQISILQQELKIHNTMSGREEVVYGEYTTDQKEDLYKRLLAFIDCPPEQEDSILRVDSVRMMKELLQQVKMLYQSCIQGTESKEDDSCGFTLEDDNVGDNAGAPGGVGCAPDDSRPEYSPSSHELSDSGRVTPSNRNAAYDLYKRVSGLGKELNEEVMLAQSGVKESKLRLKELVRATNAYKSEVDKLSTLLEEKTGGIVRTEEIVLSEEAYSILGQLQESKRMYRDQFQMYNDEKEKLSALEDSMNEGRLKLLTQFEQWYVLTGGALPSRGGVEDQMDDKEKFDELQRSKMGNDDPGCSSYMNALKKHKDVAMLAKTTSRKRSP